MPDFEELDFYQLLGVERSASPDEIRRAYRREISKYHPDRFVNAPPDEQTYAERRSQRITEAYRVLSDFGARSDYNQGRASTVPMPRRPRDTPPPQPRDHQAELYEQAQGHLAAGRTLQAVGVLRQLQQINPFYRDSAELLARAEAQVQRRSDSAPRGVPRALVAAGGAAGVALIAAAIWLFSQRSPVDITGASTPPTQVVVAPTAAPTLAPTAAPEPTVAVSPTAAPTLAPTTPATTAPAATSAPTAAPTVATAAPTLAATTPPSTPTRAPTSAPALAGEAESGALVQADAFDGPGWADIAGNGWQVGYQGGRYRISVVAGAGTIWSYRTGTRDNISVGVDMTAAQGQGGLLLRFADAQNYLNFSINPGAGSYLLEQRAAGGGSTLASGQSSAIRGAAGASNRLTAHLRAGQITLFINGQQVASASVPGAASQNYGLVATGTDTAAEVFFDNLEIRALE